MLLGKMSLGGAPLTQMFSGGNHTAVACFLTSLVIVGISVPNDAFARKPCSPDIKNLPRVTTTKYGKPLTDLVEVNVHGETFRVPVGYLVTWPITRSQECEKFGCDGTPSPIRIALPFSFWMPNGRFVEKGVVSSFRQPCESGRPTPDADAYVVKVVLRWPFLPDAKSKLDELSPPSKAAMLAGRGAAYPWKVEPKNEFGLTKYYRSKVSYELEAPNYYGDDGDFIVDARCILTLQAICSAYLLSRSDNLVWRITFPAERIEDWREIANLSRDLMVDWHESEGAVP